MYNYPLNDSHFTFWDRIKIAAFVLDPRNRWTQDVQVKKYEAAWKEFTRAEYTILTSSGSTANTLVAEYVKDKLLKEGAFSTKNKVILPSVTWMTSISPWIRLGFEPVFIDVTLNDFSMDLNKLEHMLRDHSDIAAVFITSLIGFTPDVNKILELKSLFYDVYFGLDNCENSFGEYFGNCPATFKSICDGRLTSTSSFYFGHQTTNGSEGGMIFTNDKEEYKYYLLAGNHGLVRGLRNSPVFNNEEIENLHNPLVDSKFDFCQLGNNYRTSDIPSYMGLLDFKKIPSNVRRRDYLYRLFKESLDYLRYYLPEERKDLRDIPFCLPIISKGENKEMRHQMAKKVCFHLGIETRPIISGNILRQTPFKKYADYKDYPVAEELNNFGFYVGLYPKLHEEQILELCQELNKL